MDFGTEDCVIIPPSAQNADLLSKWLDQKKTAFNAAVFSISVKGICHQQAA